MNYDQHVLLYRALQALQFDMLYYGTAFMVGTVRISPKDVYE